MQLVDDNGNVFGGPFLEITGPDGKPKTISSGTPIGPAGGDLSGTYPNPSVVWNNGIPTYNSLYFPIPTGTTVQYIRGDGSLATFPAIPAQYNPTAGTGISITGAYPNQTITNTLTLTTTGTSGAATLVGATLNIPQYGGGGNRLATHILTKPRSLFYYSTALTTGNLNVGAITQNVIISTAFTPAYDLSINTFVIEVTTLSIGGLAKVAIYSDLDGVPHTKLLESVNVSTDTTGTKTITGFTFTFTAGVTYWIAVLTNTATAQFRCINPNVANLAPVIATSISTQVYTSWFINTTYASLPSVLTTPTTGNLNHSLVAYLRFRAV
jgi:hypothetical protein